ncbi:MAG TPA: cbb3-type cytochrome c oxidase subunit I [Thermoleophilaceae bacterium]
MLVLGPEHCHLELFITVMVAYMFVLLGVVRERVALLVIFLDIVLYSMGGVIGTMHHLYFSGEPAEHMALGAFFSAAEVIPRRAGRRDQGSSVRSGWPPRTPTAGVTPTV